MAFGIIKGGSTNLSTDLHSDCTIPVYNFVFWYLWPLWYSGDEKLPCCHCHAYLSHRLTASWILIHQPKLNKKNWITLPFNFKYCLLQLDIPTCQTQKWAKAYRINLAPYLESYTHSRKFRTSQPSGRGKAFRTPTWPLINRFQNADEPS